jgi:hypothetical protein
LYLIARKMVSPTASLFAVAFYLLDPAVVLPSRAFMPDPLMIMLLVMSVYFIVCYHEQPTTGRLMVAVVVSSLALFVKPGICLFQIYGAFFALMVYRRGLLGSLRSLHVYLFAVLTLIPMAIYYALFLRGVAGGRIEPELLLSLSFWRGWLWQIEYMVGYVAFAGALLGMLLLRPGLPRALLAGLWAGYFLFGLVFEHHVQTHDYYSLQVIPVVALSLGAAWDSLSGDLWRATSARFLRVAIVGFLLLALALGAMEHWKTVVLIARQGQGAAFPGKYVAHGTTADYERRAAIYREIGEVVDHSPRTIMFAPDYGHSLAYHGRLDGVFLYPESKSVREDFRALYKENSPRYAIVIKRFAYYPRRVDWSSSRRGSLQARMFSPPSGIYNTLRGSQKGSSRLQASSRVYLPGSGESRQEVFHALAGVEAPVCPLAREESLPHPRHVLAVVEFVRVPLGERFVEFSCCGDDDSKGSASGGHEILVADGVVSRQELLEALVPPVQEAELTFEAVINGRHAMNEILVVNLRFGYPPLPRGYVHAVPGCQHGQRVAHHGERGEPLGQDGQERGEHRGILDHQKEVLS